jgi:hypothetical protein
MSDAEPFEAAGPVAAESGRSLLLIAAHTALYPTLGLVVAVVEIANGANPWRLLAPVALAAVPAAVFALYRARPLGPPRLVVDPVSQQLLFVNCWQPSGHTPRPPEAERVCSFEDVRAVNSFTFRDRETLVVAAAGGVVVLTSEWSNYARAAATLRGAAPAEPQAAAGKASPVTCLVIAIVLAAGAALVLIL